MSEDEQIKELLKRHQDLQNQKAIAEDRLGTARINLQKAKEDAREKYGTDDPGKLSAKLDESRAENENKIAKFAKDLGMVEENLKSIDEQAKTAGDND
jgi:hypothetical protein